MLDDLYMKASRPANDCVLMLFQGNYLARTGVIGLNATGAQNTWRNNLNMQKGVGCYAPPAELASQAFLDEPRSQCQHLIAAATTSGGGAPVPSVPTNTALKGATCALCSTGAKYRGEGHRKWLKIGGTNDTGYAVVDLTKTNNFLPYVAPKGARIPLLPLVVALYHDAVPGLVTAGRRQVDTADFATDFNFATSELHAYFDDDPTGAYAAPLLNRFPANSYSRFATLQAPPVPQLPPKPATKPKAKKAPGAYAAPSIAAPALTTIPAPPPTINSGWEAERFVEAAPRADGWTVYDVSRQRVGYDLFAQKGQESRYVDVKSSLGPCTPVLTEREWYQARTHRTRYVLAIVENFNPNGSNTVAWFPDPSRVPDPRRSTTIQVAIPRGSWYTGTVTIDDI